MRSLPGTSMQDRVICSRSTMMRRTLMGDLMAPSIPSRRSFALAVNVPSPPSIPNGEQLQTRTESPPVLQRSPSIASLSSPSPCIERPRAMRPKYLIPLLRPEDVKGYDLDSRVGTRQRQRRVGSY
ncbi:unnamed protein product [Toxocara canis]|uniref:Uncharacterized protein n=1 Tax=Toxocara canis TaxID=6265 RepID=A0A183V7W5_TOXCA|nr:unnamed protein product [Toxocara canis]